ncbi:MAG: NAD(P)H-binding protein [Thermoleophilaceae bacterium]|nr:NAD(P)H-binding protein [Thermoleophilaceae bacterium]
MSADRVVCSSCGSVWMSGSAVRLLDRSERCLRCGGELRLARGARAPDDAVVGIAGASGPVGRAVASRLEGLGVPRRLVVADALPADQSSLSRALEGVKALVLVDFPQVSAIDAARAAGVERLVYVSELGADADATHTAARRHFEAEERARTTGMPATILRPSLHLDLLPTLCSPDGVLRSAAADGRVASVSRGDLADVAVAALTRDGHVGRTYDVTGPDSQTMEDIARHLSVASGRRVSYVRETVDEARESRIATGAAVWEAEDWSSCFGAIAAGEMDVVSDTVTTITGHEPETLADFLGRHPESLRHLAPA